MKEMGNNKVSKNIYIYIVLALYLLTVLVIPFIRIFDLSNNNIYRTIIFSLGVFDFLLLLIVVIAEISSLKFDRTANKNTAYSAIFILLSFLTNKDTISSFNYLFPETSINSDIITNYIAPITSIIAISFAFYFMFRFFEDTYALKKESLLFLLVLLALDIGSILFISFNINIGIITFAFIEGLWLIYFSCRYLWTLKGKPNLITIILCFCICLSLAAIVVLPVSNLLGLSSILYASIIACFISVYIHFFMDKTNIVYALEDDEISKEKRKIINVKCFNSFDCFIDGNLIKFPSKKCKEFFALLVVLKGNSLSMDKAITYLYPDKDIDKSKISYRDIIWKLRRLFANIDFEGVVFNRSETILNTDYIVCDYYNVLDKKKKYNQEPLMPEYEWSIDFENELRN